MSENFATFGIGYRIFLFVYTLVSGIRQKFNTSKVQ